MLHLDVAAPPRRLPLHSRPLASRGIRGCWGRSLALAGEGHDRSQLRALIHRLAAAEPSLGGALRIHSEFLKLGIAISGRTWCRAVPDRPTAPALSEHVDVSRHHGHLHLAWRHLQAWRGIRVRSDVVAHHRREMGDFLAFDEDLAAAQSCNWRRPCSCSRRFRPPYRPRRRWNASFRFARLRSSCSGS